MPKVICTLENAADEISGVKFTDLEEGAKISEEISEDVAASFLAIDGYKLHGAAVLTSEPAAAPKAAAKSGARAKTAAPAPVESAVEAEPALPVDDGEPAF
jgi:hypothetical protein